MNIFDAFKIAYTNLRQRGLRSGLTLLGIFAGIATIVALISLGQGLQAAVADQFTSLGVNTITIQGAGSNFGPPGSNAIGKLNDHDVRLLEEIDSIEYAIPRYIKLTNTEYRNEQKIFFGGSLPEGENGDKVIELSGFKIEEGRFIGDGDDSKVTIGSNVKFEDDVRPEIGNKITINEQEFSVAGILKKKGNPIFFFFFLITQQSIKDLLGLYEDYSMIIASVQEGEDIEESKEVVARTMRRDRGQKTGEEDFELSSPQEALDSLNEILIIIQVLLVGIAFISLIVGSIGILNTMYTAVLERRTEIGIMKSIGARNNDVLMIFLIESGLLGFVGGLLGLIIGASISKGVELAAYAAFGESILQTVFPAWLIVGSVAFAFLLGAASGTLPARQAAKLQPVDALRK